MNNKTTNKPPFKVKCTHIVTTYSTVGKEYDVVEAEDGFYKIKQEFSVGDKVVINKISDGYVSLKDENVKEGDIATVIKVSGCDLELSNANWKRDWWFSRNDLSLADNSSNYNLLTHQEVIQATLDDKDVEIQYTDGTWDSMSPVNTTLHQLTTLKFRLKPKLSLEDKRKAVIKKLLETKVAVLCKCWDSDVAISNVIVAITKIDDDCAYPYMNNCLAYEYAYAIDDNGNEITNV